MNLFKVSKFFLYLAPLSVIIVSTSTLFPFIVGKYVFFRTAVGLALIFFLLGWGFQNRKIIFNLQFSIFKSPLVIAVAIFTFIFILTGFLGVDPVFSFWSNFERGEGGLQMLTLFIFFFLLTALFRDQRDWHKLFWVSIIATILMIFYGIGAELKYIDAEIIERMTAQGGMEQVLSGKGGLFYQTFKSFIGPDFRTEGFRFSGSIGNAAYVATYLIFSLFYSFYLLIDKYGNRLKSAGGISLALLSVVFGIFFYLAATRGAFIGLMGAIILSSLYLGFLIKSWRQWLLGGIILLVLVVGLLVFFRDNPFIKSLPGSRIFDISLKTQSFTNRAVIWKIAYDGFKERPILGWGSENFITVFDKHYNIKHFDLSQGGFGAWYDRAHNLYLDYLISAGILGLLSYLAIFGVFYWQLFRTGIRKQESGNRNQKSAPFIDYQLLIGNALMFAVPIAYLIQGLVLFEVFSIYLNLFLFLAFANYQFNLKSQAIK